MICLCRMSSKFFFVWEVEERKTLKEGRSQLRTFPEISNSYLGWMELVSEDVISGVGADVAGWTEIGRGPTDRLLDAVDR